MIQQTEPAFLIEGDCRRIDDDVDFAVCSDFNIRQITGMRPFWIVKAVLLLIRIEMSTRTFKIRLFANARFMNMKSKHARRQIMGAHSNIKAFCSRFIHFYKTRRV